MTEYLGSLKLQNHALAFGCAVLGCVTGSKWPFLCRLCKHLIVPHTPPASHAQPPTASLLEWVSRCGGSKGATRCNHPPFSQRRITKRPLSGHLLVLGAAFALGVVGIWCPRLVLLLSLEFYRPGSSVKLPVTIPFRTDLEPACAALTALIAYGAIAV
jgi:hypothetical protein